MKTYTIHILRHAFTRGNLEGRYIGQTDESLCREGIEQLKKMKSDYNYPNAQVVFSSSLKRCTETAKILYPDKTPIEMRGFEECDFGEFEGHTAEELAPYKEFSEWLAGKEDAKPLNGESNVDFSSRICDTFNKTVEGLFKTGITEAVIITHGGVLMTLMAAFGLPELPMTEWLCPSCCGYTVRITPMLWEKMGKFEVVADIPGEPLTDTQEERLWDYYREIGEDDDYDYERDIKEDFIFGEDKSVL